MVCIQTSSYSSNEPIDKLTTDLLSRTTNSSSLALSQWNRNKTNLHTWRLFTAHRKNPLPSDYIPLVLARILTCQHFTHQPPPSPPPPKGNIQTHITTIKWESDTLWTHWAVYSLSFCHLQQSTNSRVHLSIIGFQYWMDNIFIKSRKHFHQLLHIFFLDTWSRGYKNNNYLF